MIVLLGARSGESAFWQEVEKATGLQVQLFSTVLLPCFPLLIEQEKLTSRENTSYLLEALLLEGVGEVVLVVLVEGEGAVVEALEVKHQFQVVVVEEEGVLEQMMVGEGVVLHLFFELPLL